MQNGQELDMASVRIHRPRNKRTGNSILGNEKKETQADISTKMGASPKHGEEGKKPDQKRVNSHFTHFCVVLQKGDL